MNHLDTLLKIKDAVVRVIELWPQIQPYLTSAADSLGQFVVASTPEASTSALLGGFNHVAETRDFTKQEVNNITMQICYTYEACMRGDGLVQDIDANLLLFAFKEAVILVAKGHNRLCFFPDLNDFIKFAQGEDALEALKKKEGFFVFKNDLVVRPSVLEGEITMVDSY